MPRTPRSIRPGRVYHLISRFVDRDWYISDEHERRQYLELLGHALDESDWRCLSHAVMSNHIHLAAIAGTQSLASWVRRVHSPFADWMNREHDRIGCIFVRGPKDIETPPERVGALIAYIHNNPVRAGVVERPTESSWTSHRAYLGAESPPRWLHVEEGLARAGFTNVAAFDAWVRTHPDERTIMDAIEREDEPLEAALIGESPEPASIVKLAAEEIGIPVAQLCSRRRSKPELLARRVAVHCAASLGVPGTRIAMALRVSQQAVSAMNRADADPVVVRISKRVIERLQAPVIHTTCGSCV